MSARPMLALAALLLLAACGEETRDSTRSAPTTTATAVARPAAVPAAPGRVSTYFPTLVLDDGDGAELCLGGVADSLPPQCGGPPIVGWDWAQHRGDFEQRNGVRWGEFMITGTFDGTSITPTEVVRGRDVEPPDLPPEDDDSSLGTAQHTDAELARIQDEVSDLPGFTGSDHGDDVVNLTVTYDDGSLQAWVDATYGEGTVLVFSALQDVREG